MSSPNVSSIDISEEADDEGDNRESEDEIPTHQRKGRGRKNLSSSSKPSINPIESATSQPHAVNTSISNEESATSPNSVQQTPPPPPPPPPPRLSLAGLELNSYRSFNDHAEWQFSDGRDFSAAVATNQIYSMQPSYLQPWQTRDSAK